jgi:AcrR family transcriptional regulator
MAKRNTRELILNTSLVLFNQFGEPHVTTNQIADEADISPGNLYYHFHNKRDIVLELFKSFIVQLDPIIDIPESLALEAEDLWFQLHLSFELKGQYRFLYRNLSDITDKIPHLDRALRGLFLRERKAAEIMISGLEQRGVMQIKSDEKSLLLNNLMLALTYWIPFTEIMEGPGITGSSAQVRAIAGVLQMILPYLREPERSELSDLTSTYLSHSN